MDFVNCVPVVVDVAEAGLFVLGLLDVAAFLVCLGQLNVAVEPSFLELDNLVLGLAHDVRDAVARIQVGRPVRQDDVLCGDEHGDLTPKAGVKINFLER